MVCIEQDECEGPPGMKTGDTGSEFGGTGLGILGWDSMGPKTV